MKGTSRRRIPVASKIPLAMAAGIGTVASSPAPSEAHFRSIEQYDIEIRNVGKLENRITVPIQARDPECVKDYFFK